MRLAALEQQVSVLESNQGTKNSPHLAPQHPLMPQPTLKTIITIIILPSLTNKPDARLKDTEKPMDHLEEELEEELPSQIKTQPDTPMQSRFPGLALSSSIMNPTVSWTAVQTRMCWET